MKTAAKVFLIIGMIVQGILIFPLILGLFALDKLENGNKDQMTTWGIVSIFFVSTLGGIFMLIYANDEKQASSEPQRSYEQSGQFTSSGNRDDAVTKLKELKDLYDQGILDETTYQEKKQKYLANL